MKDAEQTTSFSAYALSNCPIYQAFCAILLNVMKLFLPHTISRVAVGLLLVLVTVTASFSQQTGSVSGNVTGAKGDTLIGVTVRLNSLTDSTIRRGMVTSLDGRFMFDNLPAGGYTLIASFVGYNNTEQTVQVDSVPVTLPTVILLETARQLNEVVIKGKTPTAEQKGDTLQFNANAFKVNRDAQAEDLIKKMPGVDMSGGGIKVQGETVQEILVDGKPFFGDDPTIALRNLPAEVIDKIEVFDRQSDQSQFTGVNDGNTIKTINITTRADKRNGQFGKVYGGVGTAVAGTDATFAAGGSVNLFKGDRRISIIGQSNNINQQNFASQDLLGVLGGGGGGNQRQGGGGGGRGGRGGGGGAPGGGNSGGGGTDNFLVGQQSGINTTNSLGINYSDSWGKKMTIRGSYFLNQSNNRNEQSLLRDYYQKTGDSTQTITVQQSGVYTARVRDANSCFSPASSALTVDVKPQPSVPVLSQTGTYSLDAMGQQVGDSYRWYVDSDTLTARTEVIKAVRSGVYSAQSFITYSPTLTCFSTRSAGLNFVVDNTNQGLSIYPNPSPTKIVSVETLANLTDGTILIYTMTGQEVATFRITALDERKQIDLTALSAGMYVMRVQAANFSVTKRFLIGIGKE